MAKHSKAPHSIKFNRLKFFAGILAAVFVLALVVNLGTSLTGYVPAGSNETVEPAQRSRPLPLYDLTIDLITMDVNGAMVTAVNITGNSDTALHHSFSTASLYYWINSSGGTPHPGALFYRDRTTGQWLFFPYNSSQYINFYARATDATTMPVRIIPYGSGNVATIFIHDGYNSSTGQGGYWDIPISRTQIGFRVPGRGENYRSIRYIYYYSPSGQVNPVYISSSNRNSYWATVRRQFQSPAATRIVELNASRIQLRQFPAYVARGSNYISGFAYSCIDTDAANSPFISGAINIRTPGIVSGGLFIPYTRDNRDSCTPLPSILYSGGERLSRPYSGEVSCGTNGIPSMNFSQVACPTPACNSQNTSCAPITTTFTCSDSDEADAPSIPGMLTIRASTGGANSWGVADECSSGNSSVIQYSCPSSFVSPIIVPNTTMACPEGTRCGNLTMATPAACNPV